MLRTFFLAIILINICLVSNIKTQTLVGYWPFTGNTGDSSLNGNNGNLINGPVLAPDRFSVLNRSYQFDGVDDYIIGSNGGNNFPTGNTARTIVAWVKANNLTSYDRNILHFGGPGTTDNFHLFMGVPGSVIVGNGGGAGGIILNVNLGDTTWHYIVGIYEGPGTNLLKIYVDGYLRLSGVASSMPNTFLGLNWRIGAFIHGQPSTFNGRLDDIRLYSGALTYEQIDTLFVQTTGSPNLVFPQNNSNGNSLTTLLDWDSLRTSTTYRVQIATDSLFTSIVFDSANITRSQVAVPPGRLNNNTRYFWHVRNIVNGEINPYSLYWDFRTALTGIISIDYEIPENFSLFQNYPNPFNPVTKIKFSIPLSRGVSEGRDVSLVVYDMLGREVETLVNKELSPGTYEVDFDGSKYASGIYYYSLKTPEFTDVKKMVLIK